MKTIRKRQLIYAGLASLSVLIGILLLVSGGVWSDIHGRILLSSVLIVGLVPMALMAYETRKYRDARLITDNPIMHYKTAVISNISVEAPMQQQTKHDEIIVSYFGILLNDKTIVFNQKGIRLKAVQIGEGFISLTYGTPTWAQIIRLLCPVIDPDAMDKISEKFRYETGINPSLISMGIDEKRF
ncbi:MAG: hypothetical protein GX129_08815 [Clostridiales bacterium]|nr:hypothetical protein [Clostridiales bacterium]